MSPSISNSSVSRLFAELMNIIPFSILEFIVVKHFMDQSFFFLATNTSRDVQSIPAEYFYESICAGRIKKLKISTDDFAGADSQITVITLDTYGFEIYTNDGTLRDGLSIAFYNQAMIQILSHNCHQASSRFDAFTVFKVE